MVVELAIGVDYVPMSLETETAENARDVDITPAGAIGSEVTNTVQVDGEDMTTIYAILSPADAAGAYFKIGYMQVDIITNENLGTGGAYGDTTLDGMTIALGYNMDLDDGMFVRAEVAHIEIDGTTLTNTNDSTKSVTADGITGMGAAVSVGKSF